MPPLVDSFIVLLIILLIARFIKRGSKVLQNLFIPSSLVAGIGGLILGPQLLGTIPVEVTDYWAMFPKYLITVVFAGLFLGKVIPKMSEVWRSSGPMIAFGNTLAWGQYVLGISLVMFFLAPVFGTNPLAGALMEISFEGGHGTAAGLAPTFAQLGWAEGTDVALALATLSIIVAILSGLFIINYYNRKHGSKEDAPLRHEQQQQMIRSGYNLVSLTDKFNTNPKAVVINLIAFAIAIGLGWLILTGLVRGEDLLIAPYTDLRFFAFLPLFPLAMIGGLLLQLFLKKINKSKLIQRRTANIFSSIALDLLIASAVATVSLQAIGDNLPLFITMGIAGVVWILGCFLVLAPQMFPKDWFVNGITNTGQSMGMTATGLLMNRLADPSNKAKAREGFAYKQLAFEPFMGGGLVTVSSVVVIYEFGSAVALVIASVATLFWLIVGLSLGHKRKKL